MNMRATVLRGGVGALAALAVVSGPAWAQERQPRSLERDLERTIEAVAELFESHAEEWAAAIEQQSEKLAETIERQAGKLANKIEVRVEASAQISDRERELRERQRELERQQREVEREIVEQRREAQREAAERRREAERRRTNDRNNDRNNNRNNDRGDRREWPEATEQFTRTINLGRTGLVNVDNVSGDITVTGVSGNDVRIEAIKRVRERSEADARARLPEVRIDVAERPGRVDVRTVFASNRRQYQGEVAYTIGMPSGASLVVKTVSSDVRITNVKGELTAETVSGDVAITNAGNIRSAKTVSGDVTITGVEGDLTGGSVNGDLILRSLKGRSVTLQTVSGDVQLAEAEFDRANIGSVNGDISYGGRLAKTGRYELHTHSGNIRVVPAGDPGLEVEANTFNGDIVSEFTLKMAQPLASGFARTVNRQVRGTYGNGGSLLVLSSFNGDISVVRR
jgi:DUF4097 and DUF4098 domain-containing protein YvlB